MKWPIQKKVEWGLGIAGTLLCGMVIIPAVVGLSFVHTRLIMAILGAAILALLDFVLLAFIYYVFKRELTDRRRTEAAHWRTRSVCGC